MEISINVSSNLKIKEAQERVESATRRALKNVTIDIANDVVKGSRVKTGHNRRSIAYKWETEPKTRMGAPLSGEKPFSEEEPELKSLETAVWSSSGYGGYLETGTSRTRAFPYFRPALDKNIGKLPEELKKELE
ncbi:MAG: hypothetical protein WDA59_04055 [Methanofastidiosum sp.]